METVIFVGILSVGSKNAPTKFTFAAVKPGRTGVVPAVVLPYRTMFCTLVLNAVLAVEVSES